MTHKLLHSYQYIFLRVRMRRNYNSSQKTSCKAVIQGIPNSKQQLLAEITKTIQQIQSLNVRISKCHQEYIKIAESNQRNMKRLMKAKHILEETEKHKNEPEHFLMAAGFMNEHVEEFMLTHNIDFISMDHNDPDTMSYEQLLELGEKYGKVSKGISKEFFESLPRIINKTKDSCPICCTQFELCEELVRLNCQHSYHEQCIFEWLKDEHVCPICKTSVFQQ